MNLIRNWKVKLNHDRKQFRRKLRFRDYKKRKNRSFVRLSQLVKSRLKREREKFWNYEFIKAPANFSLIDNTEEMLRFIASLNKAFMKRRKAFVQLHSIKNMSDDAIVLLLSNVLEFKSARIDFNGSRPANLSIARRLQKSGFFDILFGSKKDAYWNTGDSFSINRDKSMYTHATKNVDSELTSTLIENSAEYLWGEKRRCRGVQRIFLELMQNTNNHASRHPGEKYWWVNISLLSNPKRIGFSFIDYGMGIFTSLNTKGTNNKFYDWINKIRKFCNPENHYDVLRLMMSGEFHNTVTGHPYRGKGIPGIYNEIAKGAITKLVIISNDAYANTQDNDYHKLKHSLQGTFVYWEIDAECKNLPL